MEQHAEPNAAPDAPGASAAPAAPGSPAPQDLAEVARLERLRGERPGAPVFPALAEAHRRAGDAAEAARVAREGLAERPDLPAGRVALALALLDLGRLEEARSELSRVLDEVPGHARAAAALEEAGGGAPARSRAAPDLGSLDEGELEAAFDEAEAEPERMVDANHVAEATLRQVERGAPEGIDLGQEGSPFATETVASLLERQGHGERARAVRAAAARSEVDASAQIGAVGAEADSSSRGRASVLATLERWLENVRRRTR